MSKVKALTLMMEIVTLIGKVDRIQQALCTECMKFSYRYFIFLGVGSSYIWINMFSLGRRVFWRVAFD